MPGETTVVKQGVFNLVSYLQKGTFLLIKKYLIGLLPDEPPKEEYDACIFLLLLLCSCSVKESYLVFNVTFVERNERRMWLN
jgi:hypothetical protein